MNKISIKNLDLFYGDFQALKNIDLEIEANKNYTKSSMVTKAFDKILNQGWLHFDSIEKGLNNEN